VPSFNCTACAKDFDVPQTALDKYQGWVPKMCLDCKKRTAGADAKRRPAAQAAARTRPSASRAAGSERGSFEENLTCSQVLAKYSGGPQTGVFTDGASHPNPGPGGWGAVFVRDGQIVAERHDADPSTTNNRMELKALIEGFKLVPVGERQTVYTDSQLCVNTITVWAKGWEKAGWKRKAGPIKNLELVQELYALQQQRPELRLEWIAAHSGNRWNEYADALATAYRRSEK
jgi:ribonuclease HI